MENKSFKKEVKDETELNVQVEPVKGNNDNKVEQLDSTLLSKDEEIKILKQQLAEAQKVNKIKKGDIRAEVNSCGDPKLVKIGLDEFGKPLWRKANELTKADEERWEKYKESIKQNNAKKY